MRPTRPLALRVALGVALFAIGVATLTPYAPSETAGWQSCFVCGERGVADIIVNIILFMPLGAALGAEGVAWWKVLGFGAALSASVEFAQLFIPGRDSSFGDVCTNTSGALIGWVLARWVAAAIRRARRPPPWQGAVAAGLGLAMVVGTGLLLRGAFPSSTYFAMWTPDLGHLEFYRGRVLGASLASMPLPPNELAASTRVQHLLDEGATLRVRALVGPEPSGLAPLFSIFDDRQREILLLGPDHQDLVFAYRTRAAAWRLDAPVIRVAGALAALRQGDTVDITLRRAGNGYCLELSSVTRCGLGFTAGSGWGMLMYPKEAPRWVAVALNIGWVAGLWLPAGFYGASRWGLGIAVLAMVVALGAIAPAVGLLTTPLGQWVGAALGILAGLAARETIVRRNQGEPTRTQP